MLFNKSYSQNTHHKKYTWHTHIIITNPYVGTHPITQDNKNAISISSFCMPKIPNRIL